MSVASIALAVPTLNEPDHFSAVEIALLLLAVAISGGLFFYRFGPILRTILKSKRDEDFSLRPIGKRIWLFVWEVLCQAKVIKQRPAPGIAHAFVFWGFLAFALVSLNHFASGLRLGFLPAESVIGRFYFIFAAIWALLVAISIAGLFYRRFFVRPPALGAKLSYESGFIAFLIFALMVTYLAAFFPVSPITLRILWWSHTAALLIFLPLIPHTKHLHLVLSPLTVFLKRDGFSKIPPLSTDESVEDFGLVTGRDVTQLIALQAYSCVECGRCTEHCPASTTGKVLNPKEIILGARTYLNSFGPNSDTPLLNELRDAPANPTTDNPAANYFSMEAAFECTTCGSCEYQCPVGIQHLPIIIGLRRGATNTGAWEDTYGTKLFLALEKNGNALGLAASERDKFIKAQQALQPFPLFDGTQEYCLWLGCMGGYDPKGREIIADFARVMNFLGTTFGVLKKEKCTGDPARRLRQRPRLLKPRRSRPGKQFETAKSPEDRRHLPPLRPHHRHRLARVRHRPRDRTPLGVHGPPQIPPAQPGTSDSIVLPRPLLPRPLPATSTNEPREIVSLAGTLVEAPRSHERSFCCGAGGGLAFLGEEGGTARVSHVRAQELADTGAQTIGTACPFCNTMFRDALGAISEAPPQLLDIAQLTARALPPA